MSKEAKYHRRGGRKNNYGVSQSLLAHAGSIRDAISLPGAVPATRAPAERAASLRHAYSIAAEQSKNPTASSAVVACDQDMVKYFCMFCTPSGPVPGVLTLTPSVIMFEPDPRSAAVLTRGAGQFQLYVDILDVIACASVMLPDAPLLTCFFGFRHSQKSQPSFFQLVVESPKRLKNKRNSIRSRKRSGELLESADSLEIIPHPVLNSPGTRQKTAKIISQHTDEHLNTPSSTDDSAATGPQIESAHQVNSLPLIETVTRSSAPPDISSGGTDTTQQQRYQQKALVLPANAIVSTTPKSANSAKPITTERGGLYTPVERSPGSYSRAQRLLGTLSSWGRTSRRGSCELASSSSPPTAHNPQGSSSPKNEEDSGWFSRTFSRQQTRPSTVQSSAAPPIDKHERLLFRFASIEDVRELTTRTIDYLDQRDARLKEMEQQNEIIVDKKLSSCSEVARQPSPPPTKRRYSAIAAPNRAMGGVSFIGTNSGAVLDAFMLSPRAQHAALVAAQHKLMSENGNSLGNSLLLFSRALEQLQRGELIRSTSSSVDSSLRLASTSTPKSRGTTSSSSQPAGLLNPTTEEYVGGGCYNNNSTTTNNTTPHPTSALPIAPSPVTQSSYRFWGVNVIPVVGGGPQLITPHVAQELSLSIAPSVSAKNWVLRYCSAIHGISYLTFFRRVKDIGPCILIIKDTRGALFGAFLSTSPVERSHYYGSGETFVFTFWQNDKNESETTHIPEEDVPVAVYTWTSRNNFLIYTDGRSIAIGGGGSYAITVDSSFLCGSSQPCSTFGNPVLSSTPDFLVRHLQVWAFSDDD